MAVAIDFSPLGQIGETARQAIQFKQQQEDRQRIQDVADMPGELNIDQLARAAAPSNIGATAQFANMAYNQRLQQQTLGTLREGFSTLGRIWSGQPANPNTSQSISPSGTQGDDSYIPRNLLRNESNPNGQAWDANNGQAFGRLQFTQGRLNDAMRAGIIPQGTTPQQFIASPYMQRTVERWHFGDIDNFIRRNQLDSYIGTSIGGVPVTMDGMRSAAHLGGAGGLLRYLQTNGEANPADSNGTRLSDYMRSGAAPAATAANANPREPLAAAGVPANPQRPVQVASNDPSVGIPQAAPDGTPLPLPRPTDAAPAQTPSAATPASATAPVTPAPANAPEPAPTVQAQAGGDVTRPQAAPAGGGAVPNVQSRLLEALPVITGLLANPSLPAPAATLLNNMYTQAMQEARGTPEYQQWREYRQQGGTSTFPQFLAERRPQGAVTTFNDAQGNQQQGVVDQSAPPTAQFPAGGIRATGSPTPASTTYREFRLRNGDTVTGYHDQYGNNPRALDGTPLEDVVSSTTPGRRSIATQQAIDTAAVTRSSERTNDIAAQARQSANLLPTLDRMERLVNDNRLWQGQGATSLEGMRSRLVTSGLLSDRQVAAAANADELASLARQQVLASLGGSLGPGVSNSDRDFIEASSPSLFQTQQGNRQLIAFLRGVHERRLEIGAMARAYRSEQVNGQPRGILDDEFDSRLQDYAARNNINDVQSRPNHYRIVDNEAQANAIFPTLRRGDQLVIRDPAYDSLPPDQRPRDAWWRRN